MYVIFKHFEVGDIQCLKLSQKSWSSYLEYQIMNIKLKKNQEKVLCKKNFCVLLQIDRPQTGRLTQIANAGDIQNISSGFSEIGLSWMPTGIIDHKSTRVLYH